MDIKNLHVVQIITVAGEYQYLKMKEISVGSFIISTTPKLQNAAVFSSKDAAEAIVEKLKTTISELNGVKEESIKSIEDNHPRYFIPKPGPFNYSPSLPDPISIRMLNQNARSFTMLNDGPGTRKSELITCTITNRFIGQYTVASTISPCPLSDIIDNFANPVM